MKLEIIEEKKFNEPIWYFLNVDGICIKCSKKLEEIENLYDEILINPSRVKESKTILRSQEI